jgi:hypothetical protein
MAQPKMDGVIEAVRYTPEGQIDLVRMYQRRGAAFSDCVLVSRPELIAQLKNRKKVYIGQRQQYLAGTFTLGLALRLVGRAGREVVTASATRSSTLVDSLTGVPLF